MKQIKTSEEKPLTETPETRPIPDWTAKKLGNWKNAVVWEVSYKGKIVGNGFGKTDQEAIQMVQHVHTEIPH